MVKRTAIRLLRHLRCTAAGTRALFTGPVRAQIAADVTRAEAQHCGEIRFVVETALPLAAVWHGLTPRARALQLFAQLHVWDTEHNNGVLIYVLRADCALEIVADRGISVRVPVAEWEQICRDVQAQFAVGRYREGAGAAIAGVAQVLRRHFPAAPAAPAASELPNQPLLL